MTHKIFIVFTAAFFICSAGFGQTNKFVYYFNSDLNTCDSAKAVLIGIGTAADGLVKLECYNKATRQLVMLAWFTDSSLSVNHGLFQTHYNNGYKETEGNYMYGKNDGIWKTWDSLGYI